MAKRPFLIPGVDKRLLIKDAGETAASTIFVASKQQIITRQNPAIQIVLFTLGNPRRERRSCGTSPSRNGAVCRSVNLKRLLTAIISGCGSAAGCDCS